MTDYQRLFPDNRHQGETDLRKAQLVMLRILKVVDYICEKNDISYWMERGTLLGAVRHKGFIPWDRDVDILMPRKEYIRFLSVAQDYLPEDLILQTGKTDPGFCDYCTPTRVVDRYSVVSGIKTQRKAPLYPGFFIDIVPVDKYRSSFPGFYIDRFYNRSYWQLFNLYYKYGNLFEYRPHKNRLKNAIKYFISRGKDPFFLERLIKGYRRALQARINKNAKLQNDFFLGPGIDVGWKKVYKPEMIFPLVKLEFEDTKFNAPRLYKDVLKQVYGDYMSIPPSYQNYNETKNLAFPAGTKIVIDTRAC